MAGVEVVSCRDVTGRRWKLELVDQGEFDTPGSALSQRLVLGNDVPLIRKFVPRAAGDRDPRYYELLDNEIRAGTRLGQAFCGRYPSHLARLVAYNVDVDEPFVLLNTYLGRPAVPDRFDDQERRQFQTGLLRAVQDAAAAGVVHGSLSLDVVRWDGRQLQLVDFESARRVGEFRKVPGTGVVDARDDLYAAGLLIRQVALNVPADWSPDRSRDPELLRTLLDPLFTSPVEHWPTPADMLRRMRAEVPVPRVSDPEADLAEGRQLFERVCESKRGPCATRFPAPAKAAPRRGWRRSLMTMVVLAMTIIGMAS